MKARTTQHPAWLDHKLAEMMKHPRVTEKRETFATIQTGPGGHAQGPIFARNKDGTVTINAGGKAVEGTPV